MKSTFIDRDGTIVLEPEVSIRQPDKLEFYPKAFQYLAKIATELITNCDGDQSRRIRNG
jgi:imidazoleglycerol-phosphate dehydratase/histidinol-phosphatase